MKKVRITTLLRNVTNNTGFNQSRIFKEGPLFFFGGGAFFEGERFSIFELFEAGIIVLPFQLIPPNLPF